MFYLGLHHYELGAFILHLLSDGTVINVIMRNQDMSYIFYRQTLRCEAPLELLHTSGSTDVYEELCLLRNYQVAVDRSVPDIKYFHT